MTITTRDDAIAITLATADAWEEVDGPEGLSSFLRILHTVPKTFKEAQDKRNIIISYLGIISGMAQDLEKEAQALCPHRNIVYNQGWGDMDNYYSCTDCRSEVIRPTDPKLPQEVQLAQEITKLLDVKVGDIVSVDTNQYWQPKKEQNCRILEIENTFDVHRNPTITMYVEIVETGERFYATRTVVRNNEYR